MEELTMVIKYECKCERCKKQFSFKGDKLYSDDRVVSTDMCPECGALREAFLHAFYYAVNDSPEEKKELKLDDYVNMAYLYANKFTIYNITNLYMLPESVVRNIIFDIKAGDTPRAKEVMSILKEKYGILELAKKAGERLSD